MPFPFLLLTGCRDGASIEVPTNEETVAKVSSRFPGIVAPLIDPAKLDTLAGKRAATPRLRKACYYLEMAKRDGNDLGTVIDQAHALTGPHKAERMKAQEDSLIRNVTILERLGCLDEAGMIKLRKGNAPTITRGPYAGEIATGDHIIPRSVTPELDNTLFNLEFMPLTLNQRKSAKVGQRQIDLARRWHAARLLSDEGLRTVLAVPAIK
ncbi:hypothetical protein N9927_00190 [Akkermansiaceae bacterium]|nr:hypothetical protein [Akkermansiaceae bacterium]MDB4276764.1 hypothetical protein [bacterium]MDB4305088.1 hypothetical protein [Akkermansiaceae bacterium]